MIIFLWTALTLVFYLLVVDESNFSWKTFFIFCAFSAVLTPFLALILFKIVKL